MTWLDNDRGVSLIAAIFIIVVLAFMGVMFVSLINTGSLTSVNDMQSAQALYIAEGGVECGKEFMAAYSSWYDFVTDPVTVATNTALGAGNFTTTINFPATKVRKSFGTGATEIRVFSIVGFPSPGGTIAVGGTVDIRSYTGIATDLPKGPRFIFPAAIGITYPAGTTIYPVLVLSANITATDTTIQFAGNSSKFLTKGTILIDDPLGDEEITYNGIQTAPAAFTGCVRGVNATLAAPHTAPLNILPLQSAQEVLVTGDGTVGNARRVISDVVDQ